MLTIYFTIDSNCVISGIKKKSVEMKLLESNTRELFFSN